MLRTTDGGKGDLMAGLTLDHGELELPDLAGNAVFFFSPDAVADVGGEGQ